MDLFEAIEKRHSYRGGFMPKGIPREDLEKIVTAGIRAPSGFNAQTTEFVIVDDSKVIGEIGAVMGSPVVQEAKAIIVVVMKPDDGSRTLYFGVEDYSAAVENMLLAVTAMGYGSVWIDGVLRRDGKAESIGDILRVPQDHSVRVILPLGIPTEARQQKEKKPFAERAWYNAYGD